MGAICLPPTPMTGTRVLYMETRQGQEPDPCYLREFDACVIERGPDHVVLDETAFYAEGGGQPYDTGFLRWDGGEAKVLRVQKEKGVIRHTVDRMPAADEVHGTIDWERRYAHMRMHTSQHLMSGLVFRIFAARTVGNQIHADRSRTDFQPANFSAEDRIVVEKRIEDRALMDLIPQSIRRLRIIEVGTADYCPCGGTHVRNVREIGRVHVLGKRSKGKETDRVEYELLPA